MLVNAILSILNFVVGLFVSVLPEATIPAGMQDVIDTVIDVAHWFDIILPLDDLIIVVAFFFAVEVGISLFRLGEFAYNKLRGAG